MKVTIIPIGIGAFGTVTKILLKGLGDLEGGGRAGRPAFARPYEYITYELVPASPAVSCMSGSSNLESFRGGRQVVV